MNYRLRFSFFRVRTWSLQLCLLGHWLLILEIASDFFNKIVGVGILTPFLINPPLDSRDYMDRADSRDHKAYSTAKVADGFKSHIESYPKVNMLYIWAKLLRSFEIWASNTIQCDRILMIEWYCPHIFASQSGSSFDFLFVSNCHHLLCFGVFFFFLWYWIEMWNIVFMWKPMMKSKTIYSLK